MSSRAAAVYLIETLALWAGEADSRDTAHSLGQPTTGQSFERDGSSIRRRSKSFMVEPAIRVESVATTGEYSMRLRWTNGKTLTVDLREPVFRLKGLRPLGDTAIFAQARVGEGGYSVVWPGDLDMGAGRLFEIALEQNGRMDTVEFLRWRWRHGLSLTAAGEALGISRRQVAYYVSGEQEVPRTVLLACKGWEVEHHAAA
jgi:hypothetical protein